MQLSPIQQRFVLHWGEMGTKWGINRTVAQIHAILFLAQEPVDAEELADTLQVSRSNVSMSIRELQSWGLVKLAPKIGERKTYYRALDDTWEMFRLVAVERKKRELDPTISLLRDCLLTPEPEGGANKHDREQLEGLLQFFEQASSLFDLLQKLPAEQIQNLLELGTNLVKSFVLPNVEEQP